LAQQQFSILKVASYQAGGLEKSNLKGEHMSTKTLKKAVKKVTAVRGNTYVLTAKGRKQLESVSGQGLVIATALRKHGAQTASQLLSRIGKAMKSKTAGKNLAFYLCIWRSEGLVAYGPKPKA
jgi:hypothetical protein